MAFLHERRKKAVVSYVGLSNMLDSMQVQEFARRKPAKRTHRPIVGATEMDGELV